MKHWTILQPDPSALQQENAAGLSVICTKILTARGMLGSSADISGVVGESTSLFDPFLLDDMDTAVERLNLAIETGEVIVVYGDYDCDGITATALLFSYLEAVGANVIYYIPDREVEGYGLNNDAIKFLHSVRKVSLIITVDNGISAIEEIDYANSLGIDVVVTDHHKPKDILPNALAIVNPHKTCCQSPFKELAGVGVAFKLVCAMEGENGEEMIEHYGDIAALGTVADVVALLGDNRTIVQQGLRLLQDSPHCGVRALAAACGLADKAISSTSAAFGLVPRINAAGRMGDVYEALELLLTDDEERASELAELLCGYNSKRKETEAEILHEIMMQLNTNPKIVYQKAIVLVGEGWHHGVVGIICSRLVERFDKPVLIISVDKKEGRASGRSVDGVSLIDAVASCSDLLTKFGGHAGAAGFSISPQNIEEFTKRFLDYFEANYPIMHGNSLVADCAVEPQELTIAEVKSLEQLEPFGEGNPSPIFAVQNCNIKSLIPMSGDKHLRLRLCKNGKDFDALQFGMSTAKFLYSVGDMVDMMITADINEYKGNESVSIKIRDIRPSGYRQDDILESSSVYESFISGNITDAVVEKLEPSRDDIAVVYRFMKKTGSYSKGKELMFTLLDGSSLSFGKMCTALDILCEMGLVTVEKTADGTCYKAVANAQKVDLSQSKILQKLQGRLR